MRNSITTYFHSEPFFVSNQNIMQSLRAE